MPDPQADTEQAAAALRVEIAPRLGQFFNALLDEGFERAEALELVRDLQSRMLEQVGDE